MTLDQMQYVVARLLIDPSYQVAFFSDCDDNHDDHGLTRDEYLTLSKIDPHHLGICSEGYTGKRFEAIESACPRTLRILEDLDPGFRRTYLQNVPFPRDRQQELSGFIHYVRRQEKYPLHLQRFLEDVLQVELVVHALPTSHNLPTWRQNRSLTRPRIRDPQRRTRLQGPFTTALVGENMARPESYSQSPREVLIIGSRHDIQIEALTEWQGRLMDRCDGSATVADLEQDFGEDVVAMLEEWFRLRVIDDAARTASRG